MNDDLKQLSSRIEDLAHTVELLKQKNILETSISKDNISRFTEALEHHVEEDRNTHTKYLELLEKISNQTLETNECISKLDKKVDLSIQKLQYEIEKIHKQDEIQNKSLDEHIAGVNTLKELYSLLREQTDKRLTNLEEPRKAVSLLKKWLIGAGFVATAITAILKLFEVI